MSSTTGNERHVSSNGRQPDGASNAPPLKVLITSEVRFVRESLGEVLGRSGALSIVGYCADLGETVSTSRERRPDMVLLDAALRDGALGVRRLRDLIAGLQVVIFAVSESVESILAWAEAGITGYIPCTAATADLSSLLADVSAGRQACSGLVAAGLLQRIAETAVGSPKDATGPQLLTPRELEIVRLVSSGLSNKEIARRLNIGLTTTKSHVHNALGKLNVQRRGQVALWMHSRLATH
jgi:two-component system nitrate/nitrite response regulator NarL